MTLYDAFWLRKNMWDTSQLIMTFFDSMNFHNSLAKFLCLFESKVASIETDLTNYLQLTTSYKNYQCISITN